MHCLQTFFKKFTNKCKLNSLHWFPFLTTDEHTRCSSFSILVGILCMAVFAEYEPSYRISRSFQCSSRWAALLQIPSGNCMPECSLEKTVHIFTENSCLRLDSQRELLSVVVLAVSFSFETPKTFSEFLWISFVPNSFLMHPMKQPLLHLFSLFSPVQFLWCQTITPLYPCIGNKPHTHTHQFCCQENTQLSYPIV